MQVLSTHEWLTLYVRCCDREQFFPPNPEQIEAIAGLKKLMLEQHFLAVPDEAAAIAAASAWLSVRPPEGRPYEVGADTSGIAIGGVTGQCAESNGKLKVLAYFRLT